MFSNSSISICHLLKCHLHLLLKFVQDDNELGNSFSVDTKNKINKSDIVDINKFLD